MVDEFSIREVKTSDLSNIYEIHQKSFPRPATPRYYETLRFQKQAPFYVAVNQETDEVLGYIAIRIRREYEQGQQSNRMIVAALATMIPINTPTTDRKVKFQLIQKVIDDFNFGGFDSIQADIRKSQTDSIDAFKKLGFTTFTNGKYQDGETKISCYYLEDLAEIAGEIEIKRMTKPYINKVLSLHNHYLKSKKTISYYNNLIKREGSILLVAVDSKNRLFGYLCARRQLNDKEDENSRRNTLNFTTMVVDERARGKGVGTALVETMIKEAKSSGIEVIVGDVRETNTGARKLYAKFGFRESNNGNYKDTKEEKIRIRKRLRFPPLPTMVKDNLERLGFFTIGFLMGKYRN